MKFEGIAASPGIGIGPVVILEREEFAVRDTAVPEGGAEQEVARFGAALEASRRDILAIRDGIAAELGEHEARIYDAHLLILDDPELKGVVCDGIRRNGRNAAFAFRAYMEGVAAHLENVKDNYLRERTADVLDVERRVLRHLLGNGPRVLPQLTTPSVLIAHDVGPSEVALLDRERVAALVTEVGGRTSHGAIVARGRGIPAVVSVRGVMQHAAGGRIGAGDDSRPDRHWSRSSG